MTKNYPYTVTLRNGDKVETYTVLARNSETATSEALELAHKVSQQNHEEWRVSRIEA